MIVSLSDLKAALGIPADDTSQDATLTAQEAAVSLWLEGQTKRRFDQPEDFTEYKVGTGQRTLFMTENIADPTTLHVYERSAYGGDWVEITDFERRGRKLIRDGMYAWPRTMEFKLVYKRGYDDAPADIQAVVVEMIQDLADGDTESAGITSEKIGDYSYTLDAGAVVGTGVLSDQSFQTIQRYKRLLA